jgi:hypothetical protein
VIKLYPENTNSPKPRTIRLYSDPPASPPPTSTVPRASTAISTKTPIPAGAPTSTDPYFHGKGYGASNITDSSGKPLLTFDNESAKQSQLLSNRVATTWDPTVPQKLDREMLVNGRVPVRVTNAIRKELGAAYDDELDHRIALSLGGSNQKSNLGLEPGRTTKGRAIQLNTLVNRLSKEVSNGKISLLEGQRRIAEAKGVKLPDIGAKPYEPEPISRPAAQIQVQSRAPAPNEFRTPTDFKSVPKPGEPSKAILPKAAGAVKDAAAGFFSTPEEMKTDPRFENAFSPYGIGAAFGMLGVADEIAKAPKSAAELSKKAINLARLNIAPEAKQLVEKTAQEIAPILAKIKGSTLKNEEVIEAAASSEILRKATSREATLASEAALLKTRQHLGALAQGKVTTEFVDTLRVVSSEATRRGRELQALGIGADPGLNTIQSRLVKQLVDIGNKTEDIVKAAEGVDFTDAKQVTAFYRSFVKPTLSEVIDEYRYINLLSSPRTHIVNAFSNILQATTLRPAVRLVSGVIDPIASRLSGKQQEYFVRQVPAYYRGMLSSFGEATTDALKAFRGQSVIERPDLSRIPTGSKVLAPFQAIPRLLEATDVFFRKVITGGEREALAAKYKARGIARNEAEIVKEATAQAEELVFRKAIDPSNASGQGALLSRIDSLTNAIYRLRDVPGVKWFVPFVQTPMNILKQGIEYSPAGLATLPRNQRKIEQLSKAAVGSTIFAAAGMMALDGRSTWAAPTAEKDRQAFYDAGLQPYALKIGGKWLSYSKLGPLAYPIAMAAAIHYYSKENPKAVTDTASQKATKALTGIAEFFSDQSYVQGIGDIIDVARGDETATTRAFANIPNQLIPLASLQRWVATMIDPVYRKADRQLSVDALIQNLKKGIPGLSKTLEPYERSNGKPSERQLPIGNSFSPVTVSTETDEIKVFRKRMKDARNRAVKDAKKKGNTE